MIDSKAYTEVYYIVNLLSKFQREKIPQSIMDNIESEMDKNYKFVIDKNIEDVRLLEDTRKILSVLYADYFSNEDEKATIMAKEKSLAWKNENNKTYNHNLFENKQVVLEQKNNKSTKLSVKRLGLFEKIKNLVFKLFKKN